MKRILMLSFLVVATVATGEAAATCNNNNVFNNGGKGIGAFLRNKTVCAMRGSENWQEWHKGAPGGSNNLIDYKKGPSDPVDPSEVVGSWDTNAKGQVIYDYGNGNVYTFTIHTTGVPDTYDFCTSRTVAGAPPEVSGAKFYDGQVACP